ncbi:MAG: TetR/AcrR family transcriptional regulator [Bacteroidota bacterium]
MYISVNMLDGTKQKIINCAIKLFNKQGFGAVTLFEIAGELNISRGNLTYHYKSKDVLLAAIAEQMWDKMMHERNKSRQLPSFENLHNEVQIYHKVQRQYTFIFNDNHVMKHPAIRKKFKEMIEQTVEDNKASIAFAITRGNMKPEPFPGLYHNIALNTWMIAFFWLTQKSIRGEKKTESVEAMIWSLLLPHFTTKGIKAFKAFYGDEYLDNLGESFESNIKDLINF